MIFKYFKTRKTKQNSNLNSNRKFKTENKNRKNSKERKRKVGLPGCAVQQLSPGPTHHHGPASA
jgi:hypothetical protein